MIFGVFRVNYSLQLDKRQDATVPFENMKNLEQSLYKSIPLFHSRLNAAAVLLKLETMLDMSNVGVVNLKHEFCRTFILGNSDSKMNKYLNDMIAC